MFLSSRTIFQGRAMNESGTAEIPLLKPGKLGSVRELVCAVTLRDTGDASDSFCGNMSFNVGDDPKRVEANRNRCFQALGMPAGAAAYTKQVHGDTVLVASRPGRYPESDALISNVPGLLLAVSVADCVSILLYDPGSGSVGAVHAGWRGSEKHIVSRAVAEMSRIFRANPSDMLAFIGPCADECCYEVGEEVAGRFPPEFVNRIEGTRPRLRLKRMNRHLLEHSGVPRDSIETSDFCTICGEGKFHSYRRDGSRSGRMLGIIGLRPPA